MSYDSSLLAHAPHVTKAEHQEGYNVDILNHTNSNEHPTREATPSRTPQPVRRAPSPETTLTVEKPRQQQRSRSNSKFWHTPAGHIALAVLAFLVVGAIVGGAVGGTVGRHNSKSTSSSSNGTGESQGSSSSGDDGQAGSSSIASIGLQPTQGAATALPGGSVQPQPTSGQGTGQGSGGGELGGRIGGSRR